MNIRQSGLILCDYHIATANTISDHAEAFAQYSKNTFCYFNPMGHEKRTWLDLELFDLLIIHYSIYVIDEFCLNEAWCKAISSFSGLKVIFIQDEYRNINKFHDKLRELGINILFTCIPEGEIEKVYPTSLLNGLRKVNTLTGYIPEYLENDSPDGSFVRDIDVGYRSRKIPFWLGKLGQEKTIIAERMSEYLRETGVKYDISVDEGDRLYGHSWVNFLKRSRFTLATESGASIIDFAGEIEKEVKKYCEDKPDASFEEVSNIFLKKHEGIVIMNQISPRIFEGIACGTCHILFEGHYSGILKPWEHYIPLKKDFSNLNEVISAIHNEELRNEICKRAYADVIASGKYSYKKFISEFDELIDAETGNQDGATVRDGTEMCDEMPSSTKKALVYVRGCVVFLYSNILDLWAAASYIVPTSNGDYKSALKRMKSRTIRLTSMKFQYEHFRTIQTVIRKTHLENERQKVGAI